MPIARHILASGRLAVAVAFARANAGTAASALVPSIADVVPMIEAFYVCLEDDDLGCVHEYHRRPSDGSMGKSRLLLCMEAALDAQKLGIASTAPTLAPATAATSATPATPASACDAVGVSALACADAVAGPSHRDSLVDSMARVETLWRAIEHRTIRDARPCRELVDWAVLVAARNAPGAGVGCASVGTDSSALGRRDQIELHLNLGDGLVVDRLLAEWAVEALDAHARPLIDARCITGTRFCRAHVRDTFVAASIGTTTTTTAHASVVAARASVVTAHASIATASVATTTTTAHVITASVAAPVTAVNVQS